jgi:hypothetical protein
MGKRLVNVAASIIAVVGGPLHLSSATDVTSSGEMTLMEQAAAGVTDVGEAVDNASSLDDVAKKAETTGDQLTSEADVHKSPGPNPDWDKILLDRAGEQEKEKRKKADKDLALGNLEEVSRGNITAPAPRTGEESAVTDEEQAQGAAAADEKWAQTAPKADQERAGVAIEDTRFHGTAAIEQTATGMTDIGNAADDASSADDGAKKAEAVDDQLTSEADAHESPEANPEGDDLQEDLLGLEDYREEKEREKADEDLALGDGEETSGENIIVSAPPADEEPAVTGEKQAEAAAATDEEWAQAAANADQQQAETAVEADQEQAEAAARADDERHQQAAAEDEERFGPADETWLEDDIDVDDPDIY